MKKDVGKLLSDIPSQLVGLAIANVKRSRMSNV